VSTTAVRAAAAAVPAGRSPRFPLLDPMRAIAALSVLLYHVAFASQATWEGGPLAQLAGRLDVGVSIFFLLSGFLLYRPFVRARLLGERQPHTLSYAWRRFLRIVPAYWLALTVTVIAVGTASYVFDPSNFYIYYGFLQVYDMNHALRGLGQAWSLCIEVTFYAFLPLWALALRRLRAPATVRAELLALGAVYVASLGVRAWGSWTSPDPTHALGNTILATLPGWMDHFALGMAVAVLSVAAERDGRLPSAVAWVPGRPLLAWLVAALCYAAVAFAVGLSSTGELLGGATPPQVMARQILYSGCALFLLLPAVFVAPGGRSVVARILGHRWLVFLGTISYGIYLWHQLFVIKVAEVKSLWTNGVPLSLVMLVIVLAGTITVSWLSWRFVEEPILRLKRLLPDRVAPPRDPETHVPMEPAPATGGR
jgi:peptidoglycan/LPS O-acetylase OafA/YrhL